MRSADDDPSDYMLCADSMPREDAPSGTYYHFRWVSNRRHDYQFVLGTGGHSPRHGGAVLPETLGWIFRDQVDDR